MHAETAKQLFVVGRARVGRGQQPIAQKHGVGASHEAQSLRLVGQRETAGTQPELQETPTADPTRECPLSRLRLVFAAVGYFLTSNLVVSRELKTGDLTLP